MTKNRANYNQIDSLELVGFLEGFRREEREREKWELTQANGRIRRAYIEME